MTHKKRVITSLFDRILLLSHPRFHSKNLEEMINILINNYYPLKLIFSTIKNRIKYMSATGIKKCFNINSNAELTEEKKFFFNSIC